MLQEDVGTFLSKMKVISSISRHSSTFSEVFIFQWNLPLKYSAEAISKIAVETYKKDIQSFKARSVKSKKKKKDLISDPSPDVVQIQNSPADATSDPQDIFSLSDRNQHLVLQSATLIRSLLQNKFASTAADLQKLQCSDVKLRDLYEKAKEGDQKGYVIVSKNLYKIGHKDFKILCVPELLCKQIVADSHSRFGFHFKTNQQFTIRTSVIWF